MKSNTIIIALLGVIFALLGVIALKDGGAPTQPHLPDILVSSIGKLSPASSEATTFYIDNLKGINSSKGDSPSRPWKDFANINKKKFKPGDRILLVRGGKWSRTLYPPKGGNRHQPVYIGAYGKGPKPVIDLGDRKANGMTIYHPYISASDITITNAGENGVGILTKGGIEDINLSNLSVINTGRNGIAVRGGGRRITILNCQIENSGNCGIVLSGSAEPKLSEVHVKGCRIKKVRANDGITIHLDSKGYTAGSNFIIEENMAEDCAEQGFDVNTGDHVLLLNNKSRNNSQGGVVVGKYAGHVSIVKHSSIDEPRQNRGAAITIKNKNGSTRLLNSLITGNGYHLLSVHAGDAAVYNNTFVWNDGSSPVDIDGNKGYIYFQNNILYLHTDRPARIRFRNPSRSPGYPAFHFDRNIYPPKNIQFYFNNANYTFSEYQKEFETDRSSMTIDPLFSDPASKKYDLNPASPGVDKGLFLTRAVSSSNPRQVIVGNALFFFKPPTPIYGQPVMFQGSPEIYHIQAVDYRSRLITLDKPVKLTTPASMNLVYHGNAMDIGYLEHGANPESPKSSTP